jgi:serine protease Do
MTRGFAWLTSALTAVIGLLVGAILAGAFAPPETVSAPAVAVAPAPAPARPTMPVMAAPAGGFPISFADVAERANPAVVSIDVASRSRRRGAPARGPEDGGPPRRPEAPRRGTGTGFIVDSRGLILTNQHVVDAAERVMVKLSDGRSFRATVVGADADLDLAVLKVDAGVPLPELPLGNSDELRVGEWVCAIGNPYAYEHTVTVGVVSFVGRKLFDQSLDQYIQTDAAISFGNSGGPLLNTAGEVVGINTAVSRQASNIGFAIPVNQAREVLPQLVETGRVARGYLGVALRAVDADLRQALGLGATVGAIVEDVTPGSPAARAGLRPYDVITAIDGKPVDSDQAMVRVVSRGVPGQPARVQYLRDGREMQALMKLAERPARGPADDHAAARPHAHRSASRERAPLRRARRHHRPARAAGRAGEPGRRCRPRTRPGAAAREPPPRLHDRRAAADSRSTRPRRSGGRARARSRARSTSAARRARRPPLVPAPSGAR